MRLCDLQRGFRRALLEGDATALAGVVEGHEGLQVYRDNVLVSLTEALEQSFPVVCRLVDRRFFAYAAHVFIGAAPPSQAVLSAYGAGFPDFLADFPPCRHLLYLPDVARLE